MKKFLSILILLQSCVPSFKSDKKMYYKVINTPLVRLEWYTKSAVYTEFPDYVVIYKDEVIDTLCIASNIGDIQIYNNDSIYMDFYGPPRLYDEAITLPNKILNCNVKIDTNFVFDINKPKKTFLK